jgi:hypothetical protein
VTDERAAEGVEHLQTAAREMIAAVRAFLDVAEDFVADEGRMASIADAITSAARGATQAAGSGAGDEGDEFGGPVQHIRVS